MYVYIYKYVNMCTYVLCIYVCVKSPFPKRGKRHPIKLACDDNVKFIDWDFEIVPDFVLGQNIPILSCPGLATSC